MLRVNVDPGGNATLYHRGWKGVRVGPLAQCHLVGTYRLAVDPNDGCDLSCLMCHGRSRPLSKQILMPIEELKDLILRTTKRATA